MIFVAWTIITMAMLDPLTSVGAPLAAAIAAVLLWLSWLF